MTLIWHAVSGFHFKKKDSLITPPQTLEEQPAALDICAQQNTEAMEVPHVWSTHGRAQQNLGSWGLSQAKAAAHASENGSKLFSGLIRSHRLVRPKDIQILPNNYIL